jgi:hypothetical protein
MFPPRIAPAATLLAILATDALATPSDDHTGESTRLAQASAAPAEMGLPASVTLTENDIQALVTVSTALQERGLRLKRQANGSVGVEGSEKDRADALAVMAQAGVTPEKLQQIAFNAGLAIARLDGGVEQAKSSIAQYEQIRAQVPPEKWADFDNAIAKMKYFIERLETQPEENLVLAELYQDEIMRAFGAE